MDNYIPYARKENYVILDIDTTGLDKYNDLITDICILKVENDEIVDKFYRKLDESYYIGNSTSKKHRYFDTNNENVTELLDNMKKIIKRQTIVGWCVDFDISFLIVKSQMDIFNKYMDICEKYKKKNRGNVPYCSLEHVYNYYFNNKSKYVEYDFKKCEDKCLATKQLYDNLKHYYKFVYKDMPNSIKKYREEHKNG